MDLICRALSAEVYMKWLALNIESGNSSKIIAGIPFLEEILFTVALSPFLILRPDFVLQLVLKITLSPDANLIINNKMFNIRLLI